MPSHRQLMWHEMEYYGFIHFNMNTFTNMEWGMGNESPESFNPTELDARQWARVAKEAGMKGIILTAKHHDGFCLWPSAYTEHSVKNAPWKNGKGDVVRELADACREYGLKMGVYLSPWDRNHSAYGSPEYVTYFHNQLKELLTNYGDIFEVWFDGANGGSGYYGGANETRKIDNKTYYQWDEVTRIVRELQSNAVIFGDGGPDVRWVGNEEGWANETNWNLLRKIEVYPGYPKHEQLRSGHEDGTHWVPAEADVSIRPGWYYHPSEDHQVKSLPHLLDIYYQSVGRNASLLLNLPVDTRGLIHENDVRQLMALKNQLDKDFSFDLAKNARVIASNTRNNGGQFSATNVNDQMNDTFWAADDNELPVSITIDFESPTAVNRLVLQEYIKLGQRIKKFTVEAFVNEQWQTIDTQTTVGYKRILRFDTVKASKIRITITESKAAPALSTIALYHAPNVLTQPKTVRSKEGEVSLHVSDKNIEIYYTTDGSTPEINPKYKYSQPFYVHKPTVIKAIAYNPDDAGTTEETTVFYDISKKDWQVVSVSSGALAEAGKLIDENPLTIFATAQGTSSPQEVVIDLGDIYSLRGFTYVPMQDRWSFGIITHYEFAVSQDGNQWITVSQGEFGNIVNNPIEQQVIFPNHKARYIRLKGIKIHGEGYRSTFGEIGVFTTN